MLCFKDMSFCQSDCINQTCVRHLSDEVKERANGVGLPIATADFSRDCKDYLRNEE